MSSEGEDTCRRVLLQVDELLNVSNLLKDNLTLSLRLVDIGHSVINVSNEINLIVVDVVRSIIGHVSYLRLVTIAILPSSQR